ncbi:hypothetical protein ACU61A_15915 [Pseudonocardia sichuanensis]
MTTTTPDTVAAPEPVEAVELTLAQRTAADLRFLADLATADPAVAAHIADTVEQMVVVLDRGSDLDPAYLVERAVEAGATEAHLERSPDYLFPEKAVDFPAGAIRLVITKLTPPAAAPLADWFDAGSQQ